MKKSDVFKFIISLTLGCTLAALVAFNTLLVWVAQQPRSLDKFTPYIEKAFLPADESFSVKIKETWLVWGGFQHPLDLQARNIQVLTRDGQIFSSFPEVSIGLDIFSLMMGRIAPASVSITRPVISLFQNEDKSISFGIGAAQPADGDSQTTMPLAAVFAGILDPNSASPLSKLRRVEIIGADVSVGNQQKGIIFSAPGSNFIFDKSGRNTMSLLTNSKISYLDYKSDIQARLEFNKKTHRLEGTMNFTQLHVGRLADLFTDNSIINALKIPLSGRATLAISTDGNLQAFNIAATGGKGSIVSDQLAGALPVRSLKLQAQGSNSLADIQINQLSLDMDGMVVEAKASLQRTEAGLGISGDASIKNVPTDQVKLFWPPSLSKISRAWVTENITDGGVTKATVHLNIQPGDLTKPVLPKEAVDANIDLRDAKIRYLEGHPALRNVNGRVHVDGVALSAALTTASAFTDTKLTNGTVVIPDLNPDNPLIEIGLDADAPAKDIVTLLGLPKLEHAKHLNLAADKASGRATGSAKLGFYFFTRDEQGNETPIDYTISAKLAGISQPAFMGKFDIESATGDLNIDTKALDFSGAASVNGASLQAAKIRYLFAPEAGKDTFITTNATANAAALKRFGYELPEMIEGNIGVALDLSMGDKTEEANVEIDLAQAAVNATDIGWKKEANIPAKLTLKTSKNNSQTSIDSFTLSGEGMKAKGSAKLAEGGKGIAALSLSEFTLGRSKLDMLEFAPIDDGYLLKAQGEALDLSGWLSKDDSDFAFSTIPALDVNIAIGTIYGAHDKNFSAVKGTMRCSKIRCNNADFSGKVDDKPFSFRISPKGKNRELTVVSGDAGGLLKAMNIVPSMEGGTLQLGGIFDDVSQRGQLKATLVIRDYALKDAPILAKMLSLASLTGFFDTLSGKGISFSKLNAPFTLQDDVITLKDAKTFGSAIGLTADGTITFPHTGLSIEGTIVPSYTLNNVVGKVPIIGNILMGGEGEGIFAANYKLKGTGEKPEVSVNPLSILTPGFLRNLFN